MLEDLKATYEAAADTIPGWKTMNKNILANLYIANEKNEWLRDCYFSALVCRYWYNIGKYYNQSRNSVDIEECYDWLIHALTYALKNRKWTDPNSSMYNDPAGPDKVINRCIASTRQIFYQASNTDKRRANFQCYSIDKQKEDFGNDYYSPYGELDIPIDNQKEILGNMIISDIITYYLNREKVIEAIIIDGICYQDTFKDVKTKESSSYNFNERKLVKHLNTIGDNFKNYFLKTYNCSENLYDEYFKKLKKMSNTRLYVFIRKTLFDLRNNDYVKEQLCY